MKINAPAHIIVGLSGGVDSSVAAYLLKQAGHHVAGIFMKNWEGDDTAEFCPAAQDLADAEAVSERLGIELSVVNFAEEYWERVFAHFLAEYRAGRTPNPDILCNKEIKFNAFLNYAKQRGADFIATGHYVRCEDVNGQTRLLKGLDPNKDQSYFLHAVGANELAQSLFPVGDLPKLKVRAIAESLGLVTAKKKDSTGICFIGERKFKTFLNEYLPAMPGKIESVAGEMLGDHDGLMFYTIGQRQGLHIGGRKGQDGSPWFVVEKDLTRNVLIVAQGVDHPRLFKDTLIATHVHWINGEPLNTELMAKTRYRQDDQACTITLLSSGDYKIVFQTPQRAITPGQSIVFYEKDVCLGGGIIA